MSDSKATESHTETLEGSIEPLPNAGDNVDGNTVEYDPADWTGPPKKCPKTGRFLPGTGVSRKGGRPHGSRDKITTTMLSMATATLEQHGQRMWEDLSATDPMACLALISKLLPTSDLSEAIQGTGDGDGADANRLRDITVRLVDQLPASLDYQSPAIEDNSEQDQ